MEQKIYGPRFLPLIALLSVMVVLPDSAGAGDFDQWQYQQLMQPSQSQLAMEAGGRVNIYDGMREADVEQAMDTQFERIGSMMFVRTVRVTDNGDIIEDSDCD